MRLKALFVAAILLAPLTFTIHPQFAFAQTAVTGEVTPPIIASTPEAVTAAKEDTSVTIEWGNMLNYAVKTLTAVFVTVVMGAATWASTFLPGIAGIGYRWFLAKYGEKFVQNLTDYAVNAVAGATKDKKLTVNVGLEVVKNAIQRALTLENEDKFLKWLIGQLGGAQGIGEKVFRKIDLEEDANKTNVLAPAVAAAKPYPQNKG